MSHSTAVVLIVEQDEVEYPQFGRTVADALASEFDSVMDYAYPFELTDGEDVANLLIPLSRTEQFRQVLQQAEETLQGQIENERQCVRDSGVTSVEDLLGRLKKSFGVTHHLETLIELERREFTYGNAFWAYDQDEDVSNPAAWLKVLDEQGVDGLCRALGAEDAGDVYLVKIGFHS